MHIYAIVVTNICHKMFNHILTQQDIFLPPKNIVDYTYGMLKFYESSTLMVATYRCKVRRRKSNIKEIAVSNGLKTQ